MRVKDNQKSRTGGLRAGCARSNHSNERTETKY